MELARATGNDPKEFVVGFDALAVYLHKDNPATELSLAQLKEIYGEGGTYDKWSDLGLTVGSRQHFRDEYESPIAEGRPEAADHVTPAGGGVGAVASEGRL